MKKLYLALLCVLLATGINYAQSKNTKRRMSTSTYNKQNKENEMFLEKQFWLGIKGGITLTKPSVQKSYAVVSPTNYTASSKKYESFKQIGSQYALELSFYFKGVSISFQPTYQSSNFAYSNSYTWTSTADDVLYSTVLTYEQDQKLEHLLLPFLVRYEFTGNKVRPYIQAGFYQGILLNATKSVTISGVDQGAGGTNEFKNEPIIVGAKDLFAKYYWGLIGGAGVYYNLGNVRLNLDIQYRYGMSNVTSAENRYSNAQLMGVGDVMDDLHMDNLAIAVGCLFPMRFLQSGFKSLDRK
jgi:hypothetical protein